MSKQQKSTQKSSTEEIIEDLLKDVSPKAPTSESTSLQEDEEEFERLLKDFISSEITEDDTETIHRDFEEAKATEQLGNGKKLAVEEAALFEAYQNFTNSIVKIANKAHLSEPKFKVEAEMLYPRYKPYLGETFAYDTLVCWDIMIKAFPTRIMNINPGAKDEELLEYAEKTTDLDLQLALISYVETLIELESCEIAYEKRRLKAKRKKIEKEVIEEHQRRIERMQKYIQAIEKEEFPVNAERLVKNYFKSARQDNQGAYEVLINNPATFAPIDTSKIKDRFFGLIKAKPEDGIRVNKELGNFLKNLKV